MISPPAASVLCRAAAARIRQLADEASMFAPAPWRAEPGSRNGDWPANYVANADDWGRFKAPTAAEAAHIAAWHPAVARAVADLFDNAAVLLDTLPPGMGMGTQMSLTVRLAEAFGVSS